MSYTQRCSIHKMTMAGKGRGGGALVLEVGYHPHKKNHVIRVVSRDQAMYACTSYRGAKTRKIGIQGVFLVIQQILERT